MSTVQPLRLGMIGCGQISTRFFNQASDLEGRGKLLAVRQAGDPDFIHRYSRYSFARSRRAVLRRLAPPLWAGP